MAQHVHVKLNSYLQVDLLVCNPPYVSTAEAELSSGTQLAAAWAGGERGMSVTRELLRALPSLLSQQVLVFWTSSNIPGDLGQWYECPPPLCARTLIEARGSN